MSALLTTAIMSQFRVLGIQHTDTERSFRPAFGAPLRRAIPLPFIYALLCRRHADPDRYPTDCPRLMQELMRYFFEVNLNLLLRVSIALILLLLGGLQL